MHHTPGPWREYAPKIKNKINEQYRYIEADEPGEKFKRAFMLSGFVSPADTRLIAAAPELLDALQWAVSQIEDDLDPEHGATLAHVRAVIAKATGAQS